MEIHPKTATRPAARTSRSRLTSRPPSRRFVAVAPLALVAIGAATFGAFAGRRGPAQAGVGVRVAGAAGFQIDPQDAEAARAALEKWAKARRSTPVLLSLPADNGRRRTWTLPAGKLGLGLDTAAMLDEAARAGDAGLLQRMAQWVGGGNPAQVAPRPAVDEARLKRALRYLASQIDRPARNARLIPTSGGFSIRGDRPGLGLDRDAAARAVADAWRDANAPDAPQAAPETTPDAEAAPPGAGQGAERISIELPLQTAEARVTKAMLQQINGVLGQYSTHFGGTGRSRGSNIALAAGRIHGTVLAPGEVFSYNRVVGPRVASAGFRDAPVIVRGELVPGIGGGICQVSSTLYNAALLSGLKIVRRSHHAFPVHYLPAGRDATVVDGAIDFQFRNDTDAPVYVAASSRGGRLSFRVFGRRTPGRTVSLYTADHTVEAQGTVTQNDPSLPEGRRRIKDRGHRGHRVKLYRVVKENGEVVARELISSDRYRPFPAVVLVGTGKAASKTKPKKDADAPPPASPDSQDEAAPRTGGAAGTSAAAEPDGTYP